MGALIAIVPQPKIPHVLILSFLLSYLITLIPASLATNAFVAI